jgi:hypothetical protein
MLLTTYFEKFISNIQPSEERITAISAAHNTLRKHLEEDAELDFPVSDSFLSGSYKRFTAIDPVKDADIILILEESSISEDKKTPKSRDVLKDLKSKIDDFYDDVNLETQRRSIQVYLSEDDIRMDVVPSIAPDGKDKLLYVPDYEQSEWIDSFPQEHINFASSKNKDSKGQFVRTVKALKWWRGKNLEKEKAPKSFLMETIIAHNMDCGSSNLCKAFAVTLHNILDEYTINKINKTLPRIEDPGISDNDLALSCKWTVENFIYFYDEIEKLSEIADEANDKETSKEKTIELWQSVFGEEYPSSLTDEEERTIKSAIDSSKSLTRQKYQYDVSVSAGISNKENGLIHSHYSSDGYKLSPKVWLRFSIVETNVPQPYQIKWNVVNHGREARNAGQLRNSSMNVRETWRETRYKGHHFMECEIYKNGVVVAKTRFIVNVK